MNLFGIGIGRIGNFLDPDKVLVIDDVIVTPLTTSSPTKAATSYLTQSQHPSPAPFDITYSPTVPVTPISYPLDTEGPVEVGGGKTFISSAAKGVLCTLTKVSVNKDGAITSITPVARSYEGYPWELAGDEYAASLSYGNAFFCYENGCQFVLPPLRFREIYQL